MKKIVDALVRNTHEHQHRGEILVPPENNIVEDKRTKEELLKDASCYGNLGDSVP